MKRTENIFESSFKDKDPAKQGKEKAIKYRKVVTLPKPQQLKVINTIYLQYIYIYIYIGSNPSISQHNNKNNIKNRRTTHNKRISKRQSTDSPTSPIKRSGRIREEQPLCPNRSQKTTNRDAQ